MRSRWRAVSGAAGERGVAPGLGQSHDVLLGHGGLLEKTGGRLEIAPAPGYTKLPCQTTSSSMLTSCHPNPTAHPDLQVLASPRL